MCAKSEREKRSIRNIGREIERNREKEPTVQC